MYCIKSGINPIDSSYDLLISRTREKKRFFHLLYGRVDPDELDLCGLGPLLACGLLPLLERLLDGGRHYPPASTLAAAFYICQSPPFVIKVLMWSVWANYIVTVTKFWGHSRILDPDCGGSCQTTFFLAHYVSVSVSKF